MTTAIVQLGTTWTEVNAGACLITRQNLSHGANAAQKAIIAEKDEPILVHVGAGAPAEDTLAYHNVRNEFAYGGTSKVFMKVLSGNAIVVVTPIA